MPRATLLNKHQKAARRGGECRVSNDEIEQLIAQSKSDDAEDRLNAAQYLCPCHIRRRIDDAWAALYRMLEDSDVRVRRAAWHTLYDGGQPDDAALDEIVGRVADRETDKQVLEFLNKLASSRRQKTRIADFARQSSQIGKCDFCGEARVAVVIDYDTPIPTSDGARPALICFKCKEKS